MKTKVAWFLIGFVVSCVFWLAWSAAQYVRFRPRDYTQSWSGPLTEEALQEPSTQWLKNARGLNVGNYYIFTPVDATDVSAQLHSPRANGLPGVSLLDDNADGTLNKIQVTDAAYQSFFFIDKTGDGAFDSYEYMTGPAADFTTFHDYDMDGQFVRQSPVPPVAMPGFPVVLVQVERWWCLSTRSGATSFEKTISTTWN